MPTTSVGLPRNANTVAINRTTARKLFASLFHNSPRIERSRSTDEGYLSRREAGIGFVSRPSINAAKPLPPRQLFCDGFFDGLRYFMSVGGIMKWEFLAKR